MPVCSIMNNRSQLPFAFAMGAATLLGAFSPLVGYAQTAASQTALQNSPAGPPTGTTAGSSSQDSNSIQMVGVPVWQEPRAGKSSRRPRAYSAQHQRDQQAERQPQLHFASSRAATYRIGRYVQERQGGEQADSGAGQARLDLPITQADQDASNAGQAGRTSDRDDSLSPLQNRPLSQVVLPVDVAIERVGPGLVPENEYADRELATTPLPNGLARGATYKQVRWRPSCIKHHPLYFEDAMLERHGHVRFGCLQPLASGGKMLGQIFMLPYTSVMRQASEENYVLGQYRAGSGAPKLRDHWPWDYRAAVAETLSAATFFWAAPL